MGRHVSYPMAPTRRLPTAPGRGGSHSGSSPHTFLYPGHRNNVPPPRKRDHTLPIPLSHPAKTFPAAFRKPFRFLKDFHFGLRDETIATRRPLRPRPATSTKVSLATAAWRHHVTTRYDRIFTAGVHRPYFSTAYGILPQDRPCLSYDRPFTRHPIHSLAEDKSLPHFSRDEAEAADAAEAASAAQASTMAATVVPLLLRVRLLAARCRRPIVPINRRPSYTCPTVVYLYVPNRQLLPPDPWDEAMPQQQSLTAAATPAAVRRVWRFATHSLSTEPQVATAATTTPHPPHVPPPYLTVRLALLPAVTSSQPRSLHARTANIRSA